MTAATGWLAALYLVLAAGSGTILAWYYVPSPEHAYASVAALHYGSVWSHWLRSIHYLTAHGSLAVGLIHLVMTLFQKTSLAFSARFWATGAAALLVSAGVILAGRILRYDENALAPLTIGLSLVNPGGMPASATGVHLLSRTLLLHVAGGAGLIALLYKHIGGLVPTSSDAGSDKSVYQFPAYLQLVVTILVAGSIVGAGAVSAPLGSPSGSEAGPVEVTADWYLRWVQQLARVSNLAPATAGACLLVLALLTPHLARRFGERVPKFLWLSVLVLLLLGSIGAKG